MRNLPLVFGADGGGTKTVGMIADAAGSVLAQRQSGPANPNVVGINVAATNLLDLLVASCGDAGCTSGDLGAVVFGIAGAGSAEISGRLLDALESSCKERGLPPLPVTIETDARIALEGAFNGGPGIIVIAGTGSSVLGKTGGKEGRIVGGWGRVLGDEGSGYSLGLQALKAVTRDLDGRAPAAALRRRLAERYGWISREQVVVAVYQQNFSIPSLAPLVVDLAEGSDQVCLDILERAAAELVDHIAVFARQTEPGERIGVVFIGGLIDHESVYTRILRKKLAASLPVVEVRSAVHPPVRGAVLMAQQRLKRGSE